MHEQRTDVTCFKEGGIRGLEHGRLQQLQHHDKSNMINQSTTMMMNQSTSSSGFPHFPRGVWIIEFAY
jgi:hypothetical protein